ncbi:TRAF-like family protein [Euphorbia peplus]|nr:TRAF-like family protein [Euphorbia peplus]
MNERVKLEAKENGNSALQPDDQSEVIQELRHLPPAHYLFKIQNFSRLLNVKPTNFESCDFEVGGYKWRLRLCLSPKEKIEKLHISLYLVLSGANSLSFGKEVNVYLKLFVYNQIQDKYLVVQDSKGRARRFSGMKKEWGFDQLLPLNVFNDPLNGYLINGSCIFGAEVFVLDSNSRKGDSAYVKKLGDNTYVWRLERFKYLTQEYYNSEVFTIGGHKWILKLYPNGDSVRPSSKGNYLSLYLCLEDSEALNPGEKLNVNFVLRVKDQLHGKHHELSNSNVHYSASQKSWGFTGFMSLTKLNDLSNGYIINCVLIFELEISLLTMLKNFS